MIAFDDCESVVPQKKKTAVVSMPIRKRWIYVAKKH